MRATPMRETARLQQVVPTRLHARRRAKLQLDKVGTKSRQRSLLRAARGVAYNALEAKEEVSPVFIFALPRTTEWARADVKAASPKL